MQIHLTVPMVLIAGIGVFLASFMDAIAGGGGIISLPTYLLAGLPMHMALGTNKISASLGSLASVGRYLKNGYVNWRLAIPSVILALLGSTAGTRLQLAVNEKYLQYLLLPVLPVTAIVVLRQRTFREEPADISTRRQTSIVLGASLLIGAYDGFYGPGTGTFLLLAYTGLGGMDVRTASGNVKLVNLSSGIASLLTALLYGKVFWALGLIASVFSFAGHFLGAGMTIRNGAKIVRPVVTAALVLLAVKVVYELF